MNQTAGWILQLISSNPQAGARFQSFLHLIRSKLSLGDHHLHKNDAPNHMVEKGLSSYLEAEIRCLWSPVCLQHYSNCAASGLGRGAKGGKIVCSNQALGCFIQGIDVQNRPNTPSVWLRPWGTGKLA